MSQQVGSPQGVSNAPVIADFEAFSANLTRAAMIAHAALMEAAVTQGATPPNMDPLRVGPTLTDVMLRLASRPDRILQAQADLVSRNMELWRGAWSRLTTGEPAHPPRDKRFSDPSWDQPMFDLLRQSYVSTAEWLNKLASEVEVSDPIEKRRVEFFTKLVTDTFSPANFLASNPVALEEVVKTNGESLVRGMENLAADLHRGGGQLAISQTDMGKFKVGENVATAPGKVVFQNDLLQLLQFDPSTEQVHETPLLLITPWINKYYIIDLRPENSLIRWLSAQGFTVFVTSWVNPDAALAEKTMEDYLAQGALTALHQVLVQTQSPTANVVGYCIGGTLLACAMAFLADRGDSALINSATFFAAQQDFSEAGDLLLFTDEAWLKDIAGKMDDAGGVLPGSAMAESFNILRANDLIWSFFVNNYLMGKEPKPFDLLFWNSDQTRMPKALHMFYLREFYKDNKFAKGELVLAGTRLDLSKVKTPVYVQSSKDDHIAPFASVYKGARLFGGPVTFTMAGSGHIAGVINPPAANKYQHWLNSELPDTVEAWRRGATEHPGSWWPHWAAWLAERSGPMRPARDPSKGPLTPIEDAPGAYVQVRS
ncbi:class I poly(R)-hydroxyalkanoic acid synthase [Phenylobacterium sp.]|uniref:class I poly(R)-hydroxyalkanoic acid synthase n=1 Tax=Phenylobacterium sp. TaxID=1871053 RepID=UPI0035252737